jgi:hypothetical protein
MGDSARESESKRERARERERERARASESEREGTAGAASDTKPRGGILDLGAGRRTRMIAQVHLRRSAAGWL